MHTQDRRAISTPHTTWADLPGKLGSNLAGALHAEAHAWRAAITAPALYVLLVGMLAGFLLIVQLPLHYSIDVGVEEGYGGDLPLLSDFNTAEKDEHGTYRWTADKATITLPGVGRRPVEVQLDFFPIGPEALAAGPEEIVIWAADEQLATLPVRREGAHYAFLVPRDLMSGGTLDLTIRTHTFVPANPDDPRALGTPMDRIQVETPSGHLPAAPDLGAVVMWLLAVLLCWIAVMRALAAVPGARWWAASFVGTGAVLVVLAAWLDPARWAFGAQPALIVAAISNLLVLVLRPVCVALAARLDIPLTARSLGWLLLIVVLAFGLRYGGRLYPRSMHGDIGFHTNRFYEVTRGHVYLLSRNRGVDFPYPPGPYIALAPFTLVGAGPPAVLQLGAALVEGLSALLLYTIVARAGKASRDWKQRRLPAALRGLDSQDDRWYIRLALLAAAIYVFTAAGFMTTWWSFDTHIYTQFGTLLLITVLHDMGLRSVLRDDSSRAEAGDTTPRRVMSNSTRLFWTVLIFVLCSLVFLGHFGFFINTVLLGGLMLLLVWPATWRGAGWAHSLGLPLTLAGIVAGVLAFGLFYSYFMPLFMAQAQATAEGGLTGLANRPPVERSRLWDVLWNAGMIQHFGFFPLLLAPIGVGALARRGRPALVTVALIVGSFLVSLMFAILPFITLSTQSTRWLMFSAWAIAVGAALAVGLMWRNGRAARVVVVAMAGYVLWNTVVLWVGPMLWRIRPPEPF
jgi:hypothetical protein